MEDLSLNAKSVKDSNTLQNVVIEDNTTTKGKVTGKFTLVDDSLATESIEKIDKNKLFLEISDFFCPVKFNDSELRNNLQPLVNSGVLSEEAMEKAIETSKKEFLDLHSEEIEAANNMKFAEVLQKLQTNESLYKKLLNVCCLSKLEESNYIDNNGKVLIYRASQCQDKEGNDRYQEATLTKTENGRIFIQPLFVEVREQNTTNILLSIRYYQSKQNAAKSLLSKVTDYKRILTNVFEVARKAKENGFSLEQIINEVNKVFA